MTIPVVTSPALPRVGLRAKLVRAMLVTLAVVSALTLVSVGYINYRSARRTLDTIESQLRQSISRKGQGLASDHALALRGLVADNAFGDVGRLVDQAVHGDEELVYGLFLGSDGRPWAYVTPAIHSRDSIDDTWKRLGIDPESAGHPGSAQAVRSVFGQTVFEFSAPVTSDDDAVLGRIYYGLSSAPLSQALSEARQGFRQSLIVALLVLAGVCLASTLLGVGIIRGLSAHITRPLAHLTAVATAIAGGKRDERVQVGTDDELGVLGRAFNQMMEELLDSYQKLEGLNRTLEARVEERTRELAHRNRDMRLVLDNVAQGFLTLTMDGVLAQERSAIIDQWFGAYGVGTRFGEYISKVDQGFADGFEVGLEALRDDFLPAEVCIAQLPKRLTLRGQALAFAYQPIVDDGKVVGLLLVVNDITSDLLHAAHVEEQTELLTLVQSYSKDRAGLLDFFEEGDRLIEAIQQRSLDANTRKRTLHTLKGNAALTGFDILARLCHATEDALASNDQPAFVNALAQVSRRWATLGKMRRTLLGDRPEDVVEIPTRDLDELSRELASTGSSLGARLATWKFESTHRPLMRLGNYARSLAEHLGKGELQVEVEPGGARLDPRRWAPFWSEMVHVIRNAVDHGLETPDERSALGKATPRLILRTTLGAQTFSVEIEDDGRGIDWEAVRNAARARGLAAETAEDLSAALFANELSTRTEATLNSGRGVGLAAVRARADEQGGRIQVRSVSDRGTVFSFTFPLDAASRSASVRPPPPYHPSLPSVA